MHRLYVRCIIHSVQRIYVYVKVRRTMQTDVCLQKKPLLLRSVAFRFKFPTQIDPYTLYSIYIYDVLVYF